MTSPNIEYACSLCKHKAEDDEQMFIVTSEHVKYTVGTDIKDAVKLMITVLIYCRICYRSSSYGYSYESK